MLDNPALYSHLAAFLAFGALSLLLIGSWRKRGYRSALLVAAGLTATWAGVVSLSTKLAYPLVNWMLLTELMRNASWLYLLCTLLDWQMGHERHVLGTARWRGYFALTIGASAILVFVLPTASPSTSYNPLFRDAVFCLWLGIAVGGLLLLEQIYRNAATGERWATKYLCLGLGVIFAYDFFMYAQALLLNQLEQTIWQARGIAVALTAPLLAVSFARHTSWTVDIHVSRHVVFHSVTLVAAGLYLIFMAIVGYFISLVGGDWGVVIQVAFLLAAGLCLVILLFSGTIRARTRVWLSKHFFSYKYDYREEWHSFTRNLSQGADNVPTSIISSIAELVNSPGGHLWRCSPQIKPSLLGNWQAPKPKDDQGLKDIAAWIENTKWIIDVQEFRSSPDLYEGLNLPDWLWSDEQTRLLVPLLLDTRLVGIVALRKSNLTQELNWEDRDLLKSAGRQAAAHLGQYLANQSLIENRQFEAFNRLSAYVIHDLKNILAQQSLIVSNADRHKDNPAFVDDVIATVENSVTRMQRLMAQMRTGMRGSNVKSIDVADLLQDCIAAHSTRNPVPLLQAPVAEDAVVDADREQLGNVFNHLISNAQEATSPKGEIALSICSKDFEVQVDIIDTGCGMDEDFVHNRLFKAFDSTKGLTGMGIGAFESREFVRSLGGDITVESNPGIGSRFTVVLPSSSKNKD